jgi:predicted nuclease with TOPRIM domain
MNLRKVITKILREQAQEDEFVYSNQDEIADYLKLMSGNLNGLSRLPKFKGKKIIINGSLDLSDYPETKNLGPIVKVDGRLDIRDTEIESTEGVEVTGYVSDYNSKMYRIRRAKENARILAIAQGRRESGEWADLDNPYNAKANALFEYLKGRDDLQDRPENLQEKIDELEDRKSQLEESQAQLDDNSEEYGRLQGQIDAVDVEIEELNDGKFGDVYDLIPDGKMYGLALFKSKLPDSEDEEYFLGTRGEVDIAFEDYWENYVDEVGTEGFNRSVIEDNLDMDRLRSDIEDTYENDIRDNPDSYLDESDKELSESQEDEIHSLESEKGELELRLHDLEPEDDEYDEVTDRIEEIETEIDEIKDSPDGDYKEEAIEEKISDTVDYYVNNYKEYLSSMGSDISDYLDKDSLVQYLIDNEDYGQMSSYDNEYDTIRFNERDYHIFRHN